MRILIDECLNWRLSRALTGHYAVSVQRMGWSGIKNGQLLALAQQHRFDVFLTGDRNLAFQQNTAGLQLAVVILVAKGTQLHQTLPLITQVLEVLGSLKAGDVVTVR